MTRLFEGLRRDDLLAGLDTDRFILKAASFLAELNAIHPFREGNGRTQLVFMSVLATEAGHPFRMARLRPRRFLHAMIASFQDDEAPLRVELDRLVRVGVPVRR